MAMVCESCRYEDFRAGFRNGAIVTLWASCTALAIGAAFAFAIDRYEFRFKRLIETVLISPLVIPHFTVGLGFLILAAQLGLARGFAVVIVSHIVLVLPFVLRSVYVSLRTWIHDTNLRLQALARPLDACS